VVLIVTMRSSYKKKYKIIPFFRKQRTKFDRKDCVLNISSKFIAKMIGGLGFKFNDQRFFSFGAIYTVLRIVLH